MNGFIDWMRQHMALALMIVVGLIIGIAFLKKQNPGASTALASTSGADLSGLATDASGNKLVYVPVTDTFYNYSSQSSVDNRDLSTTTTNTSYSTTNPAAPVEHPIAPTPPPVSTSLLAIVRAKGNSTLTTAYDAANPQGIPIRATPDGKILSYAPYGSQLALSNKNITTGATNLPSGAGSNQWFAANGGYVSAYDLTGFVS